MTQRSQSETGLSAVRGTWWRSGRRLGGSDGCSPAAWPWCTQGSPQRTESRSSSPATRGSTGECGRLHVLCRTGRCSAQVPGYTHTHQANTRPTVHTHTYIHTVRVILTRCFHKEELLKQQLDFHEPDIFPCHSTYSVRAVQENPVVWSSFVL